MKKLSLIAAMALSSLISSAPETASAEWTAQAYLIANINCNENGTCNFELVGPEVGPSACRSRYVYWDIARPGGAGILSIALAANLSGKSVLVDYDDATCLSVGTKKRPKLVNLTATK